MKLLDVEARKLAVKLRASTRPVRMADGVLEERHHRREIASTNVKFAQQRCSLRVRGERVEGVLEALDRPIEVASRLENAGGTNPLFGTRLRCGRAGRKALDGRQGRHRVARTLAKTCESLESLRMACRTFKDGFVGRNRLLRRPDIFRENARALEKQVDAS